MSDTKISKKSWTAEEDTQLLGLVEQYGLNGHWSTISSKMGNRTGKQCRERYHNHLKPDIWKGTWTPDEDDLLNESQKTMGNQWAKIAKLLPGRSDNSVKNRWHIINRKKNSSDESAIACVSVDTSKPSRPVIPKLALGVLTSAAAKPAVVEAAEEECDLMSFHYSHSSHEHCHRATDSTRTTSSVDHFPCPGSGRRDFGTTAAGPADAFDDDFVCDEVFDALLEDAGNAGVMSFNNTLSSCISELTTRTSSCAHDELSLEDLDPLSARSAAWGQLGSAMVLDNIDRFSEAALSFRDMDSVLDDLAQGGEICEHQPHHITGDKEEDQGDDLFLFDLMDEQTMHNTMSNASPMMRSGGKQTPLNRFVSTLLQQFATAAASSGNPDGMATRAKSSANSGASAISEFSPRSTPRSPLCPRATKRQRASRTPRSPYQAVMRVI